MKKRFRQVLSTVLVAMMVITGLPDKGVTVYAEGEAMAPVTYVDYDADGKQLEALGECKEYTVLGSSTRSMTITTGWYVVNSDVTVSGRITVSGVVRLILCDGAELTATKGITVDEGNELTIYGQVGDSGKLTVEKPGNYYSGIGSYKSSSVGGTITINGGTVTATGGNSGSGIGSAGTGGTVTINGGTITATGGGNGSGIGSVVGDGTVIINGGTITATGGQGASGVGSYTTGGTVIINGGTITATGGLEGSGIGVYRGGTVIINGGTVTANGGQYGPGVGVSYGGEGGTVTINDGTILATGGSCSAGIGGAWNTDACDITIKGGSVTAIAGSLLSSGNIVSAIGHGECEKPGDNSNGTLTLGENMTVKYGTDASNIVDSVTNSTSGVSNVIEGYTYAKVFYEAPHVHTYSEWESDGGDTHSRYCMTCNSDDAVEQKEHTFGTGEDDSFICQICGHTNYQQQAAYIASLRTAAMTQINNAAAELKYQGTNVAAVVRNAQTSLDNATTAADIMQVRDNILSELAIAGLSDARNAAENTLWDMLNEYNPSDAVLNAYIEEFVRTDAGVTSITEIESNLAEAIRYIEEYIAAHPAEDPLKDLYPVIGGEYLQEDTTDYYISVRKNENGAAELFTVEQNVEKAVEVYEVSVEEDAVILQTNLGELIVYLEDGVSTRLTRPAGRNQVTYNKVSSPSADVAIPTCPDCGAELDLDKTDTDGCSWSCGNCGGIKKSMNHITGTICACSVACRHEYSTEGYAVFTCTKCGKVNRQRIPFAGPEVTLIKGVLTINVPEKTYYFDADTQGEAYYEGLFTTLREGEMYFDFYLWDNDHMNLRQTVQEEVGKYVPFSYKVIGGVLVAYYTAEETDDETGEQYQTLTAIFDAGEQYAELVFGLVGEDADAEAWAIINSVKTTNAPAAPADSISIFGDCVTMKPVLGEGTDAISFYEGGSFYYGNDATAADQVGYYYSMDTDLDFDVYQWTVDADKTLVEIAEEEIAEEGIKYITAGMSDELAEEMSMEFPVPFILYTAYESVEEGTDTVTYLTATFIMKNGTQATEFVFWLGENTIDVDLVMQCVTLLSSSNVTVAHTFGDWEIVTAATTETEGLQQRTCSVCDFAETEVIPVKEAVPIQVLFDIAGIYTTAERSEAMEIPEYVCLNGFRFDYWEMNGEHYEDSAALKEAILAYTPQEGEGIQINAVYKPLYDSYTVRIFINGSSEPVSVQEYNGGDYVSLSSGLENVVWHDGSADGKVVCAKPNYYCQITRDMDLYVEETTESFDASISLSGSTKDENGQHYLTLIANSSVQAGYTVNDQGLCFRVYDPNTQQTYYKKHSGLTDQNIVYNLHLGIGTTNDAMKVEAFAYVCYTDKSGNSGILLSNGDTHVGIKTIDELDANTLNSIEGSCVTYEMLRSAGATEITTDSQLLEAAQVQKMQ